jgi:hypothetical protein
MPTKNLNGSSIMAFFLMNESEVSEVVRFGIMQSELRIRLFEYNTNDDQYNLYNSKYISKK